MNLEIQRVRPDSIEKLHKILEKCGQDERLSDEVYMDCMRKEADECQALS